ncbi:substrate binding domain-containing protein [Scleromatobacter humisilvae]|uniref:Substrate binding domain-containing protein n=1 Tax=Scleromatobacter humisilvae TaxID=2897159 RepID=A0A9X1YFG5_9BURK|nr:substrate binding domain-containing protein [Scleromatobacter humisilvae]MCK9684986.1 substrate binding domain-containing protein [Scleromatobacter humisilvae]
MQAISLPSDTIDPRPYFPTVNEIAPNAASGAHDLTDSAVGLLRVTAPVTWGRAVLVPLLPAFLANHPRVRLQLTLLDRAVDLASEGYDLAIRLTPALPEGMVARRLAPLDYVACAAAKPKIRVRSPEDLATVPCLVYGEGDLHATWRFRDRTGRIQRVKVQGPLMINDGEAILRATQAGVGVAVLPRYLAGEALRDGSLRELLPTWTPLPPVGAEPHVLWLRDRYQPLKARLFIDHLLARLRVD